MMKAVIAKRLNRIEERLYPVDFERRVREIKADSAKEGLIQLMSLYEEAKEKGYSFAWFLNSLPEILREKVSKAVSKIQEESHPDWFSHRGSESAGTPDSWDESSGGDSL